MAAGHFSMPPTSIPAIPEAGSRRSFSRKAPEVRRQELIAATLRCLCRHGASETSVRTIAQEAGLSLGMVRHHFRTKDELLAATLRHLSAQIQDRIREAMAECGADPVQRFHAFIAACLHPSALDEEYVRARFLFFGLAQTNPSVRKVHDEIYGLFEAQLRDLIAAVAKANGVQVDLEVMTLTVLALLKGVWVEWSLSPKRVDPRQLVLQILPALERSLR